MGLCITYALSLNGATRQEVRQLLGELHRNAGELSLEDLGELVDLEGEACHLLRGDPETEDPDFKVKFGAMTLQDVGVIHQGGEERIPSCAKLIGFEVLPGAGCSACTFGLASQAATPDQWRWYDYCKTQYASSPDYGGLEHFLQCHLAVIKILDGCRRLGILDHVSDESGYWEERNPEALITCLRRYNIFTAAAIGTAKDLLEPLGYKAEAPILSWPDFEHLEARGRSAAPPSEPPAPLLGSTDVPRLAGGGGQAGTGGEASGDGGEPRGDGGLSRRP